MKKISLDTPLVHQCRDFLIAMRGKRQPIQRACGINQRWINRLINDPDANPGVRKVEAVLRYKLDMEAQQRKEQRRKSA